MVDSSAEHEVRVPEFDIPGAELVLSGWLTSSGTEVMSGDPLCEICAGDIVVEIPARRSGVFHQSAVEVDAVVETGGLLGTIEFID